MPYIPQNKRPELERKAQGIGSKCQDEGELNNAIVNLMLGYLFKPRQGHLPRYRDFNQVMGVFLCAALELWRRLIIPYEDKKCAENGDVFPR